MFLIQQTNLITNNVGIDGGFYYNNLNNYLN
jgi:hypothetical protein